MKLSYRWLARHVDLTGASAVDIAKELTLSTAEVEGVEPFVWMPVRSRRTIKPITAETAREVLSRACEIFHYWLDRTPAEGSALIARDRAWSQSN